MFKNVAKTPREHELHNIDGGGTHCNEGDGDS